MICFSGIHDETRAAGQTETRAAGQTETRAGGHLVPGNRAAHCRRRTVTVKNDSECDGDESGTHFFPNMGLMFMLTLTVWFVITRAICFAKNPDKYTEIEMSGMTFAGSLMGSMFMLGVIGSYRNDPSLLVAGLIATGVGMFMAGSEIVSILSAMIRQGGVYGNDRCARDPVYFATYKQYCNAQTVVHILFNWIIFFIIAALFNSTYDFWKCLIAKKENERQIWTKEIEAARRDNNSSNASLANSPIFPTMIPNPSIPNSMNHPPPPSVKSCEKMKASVFY